MATKVLNREFFVKSGADGGRARAKNLTKPERQAIAARAAKARWGKKRPKVSKPT